jgi:hypothetical protein
VKSIGWLAVLCLTRTLLNDRLARLQGEHVFCVVLLPINFTQVHALGVVQLGRSHTNKSDTHTHTHTHTHTQVEARDWARERSLLVRPTLFTEHLPLLLIFSLLLSLLLVLFARVAVQGDIFEKPRALHQVARSGCAGPIAVQWVEVDHRLHGHSPGSAMARCTQRRD